MLNYLKTHLFYVILIAVGIFAFHAWLQEHDQRVEAQTTVRESAARVKDLEAQVTAVKTAADAKVKQLQTAAQAVKTPSQAIAAIPDVSNLPLNIRPLPDNSVSVDPVQLYQELAACRVTEVKLDACQKTAELKEGVIKEKDNTITALKRKPGFWKRLGGQAKSGSIFISVGIAIAKVLL